MRFAIIDGTPCSEHEATVSVFDRGFLLGDAALETMRTYGGEVLALELHLERLERSLRVLGISAPCTRETLHGEIVQAVAMAAQPECAVRLVVTRGRGPAGLDPVGANRPLRAILVEPLAPPSDEAYRRGLRVRCIRTVRASDAAVGVKLPNYIASILATRQAREAGADEALIVGARGTVIEGATGNLFAVVEGALITPDAHEGVLDGITRRLVLDLARKAGLPIAFQALPPHEVAAADEAFVTSSLREVMAIAEVDGHPLLGAPGPITRALHRAFRALVGAPPPPYDRT